MKKIETQLGTLNLEELQLFYGYHDSHLKLFRNLFKFNFQIRSNELWADEHEELTRLVEVIDASVAFIQKNSRFDERDLIYLNQLSHESLIDEYEKMNPSLVGRTQSGKAIFPKTLGQYRFIEALKDGVCVIASGPAGTGKTYLSVVYAVQLLKKGDIKKIILTRPVVEAGENLGFLPGDLKEKIDPYLRPLYDALYDLIGTEQVDKYIEKGVIEIAPLAYMRGRTFDDAFVILDEAQNTTKGQMLMFLTRMGFQTRMVVTGDISQVDLKQASGLVHAKKVLSGLKQIRFVELSKHDIVRHPLVQEIIEAYENE